MVSGTPVIIFGPAETALVKNAIRGNWAKVITEDNIDALAGAINELVTDEQYRKQITETAISIAETKFNSVVVRNNFREIITSIKN